MPGPAPKHPSRRTRRNSGGDLVALPASGREGPPPEFPLVPDVGMAAALAAAERKAAQLRTQLEEEPDRRKRGRLSRQLDGLELSILETETKIRLVAEAEAVVWQMLWSTPQAAMWDQSPVFVRELALFVRFDVQAEMSGDQGAAREARQRGDRLGTTPLSLLRLRREIEETKQVEERGQVRRERFAAKQQKKPGSPGDPRAGLYAV